MLIALIALLQAPDAAQIGAAVRKAGERRYRLVEDGKTVGTVTLKTKVDGASVVFEDTFDMMGRKMAMRETARLEDLSLVSASRKMEGVDWTLRVEGKKALMKVEGRDTTLDLPGPVLGELAALRLVAAAPRKEGATSKRDIVSFPGEELRKDVEFRCAGKEEVELGGKKRPAFKWTEKWRHESTVDGVKRISSVDLAFWVSPDGVILRSSGPGPELLLVE